MPGVLADKASYPGGKDRSLANQVHQQLVEAGIAKGIAIDGKSIRRAASLGSPNAYVVAAVCHQLRIVLKQGLSQTKPTR